MDFFALSPSKGQLFIGNDFQDPRRKELQREIDLFDPAAVFSQEILQRSG